MSNRTTMKLAGSRDRELSHLANISSTVTAETVKTVSGKNIRQLAGMVLQGLLTEEQAFCTVAYHMSGRDRADWFMRSNFYTRRTDTIHGMRNAIHTLVEVADLESLMAAPLPRHQTSEGEDTQMAKDKEPLVKPSEKKAGGKKAATEGAEAGGEKAAKAPRQVKLHPAVQAVACPTCKQAAGTNCVGPKGNSVSKPHATREKAAAPPAPAEATAPTPAAETNVGGEAAEG